MREIHAFSTLERWQEASSAAQSAIDRFGDDQRLLSLLAVSEEMLGRTGAAFSVLERALAAGDDRVVTLHNYMAIALRLGRIECVRQVLDKLLATNVSRADRLEFLRLRTLLYIQEGDHTTARRLIAEVARVADRSSENEEGMFLNLFMAAKLSRSEIDDAANDDFSARVNIFSKAWPESRLFRKFEIPETTLHISDDAHQFLDPIVDNSRKRLKEFEDRERQLKSGDAVVPYILRPGYAIHYIGNAFDLWAITKQSKDEDKQLHLQSVIPTDSMNTRNLLRDVPILDLTTLLVLDSLSLFDRIFDLFPLIAIPKQTISFISQHANNLLGGVGAGFAKSILASINRWVNQIEQPNSNFPKNAVVHPSMVVKDYLQLAQTGRWSVYCDDSALRMLHRREAKNVIDFCTTDLLSLADGEGIISVSDVVGALSQLVAWNIGINVKNRYLVASLIDAMESGKHLGAEDRLDFFGRHEPFIILFRALTNPQKTPSELIEHMGQLLTDMLQDDRSEIESISAVLAFWFNRVRIFPVPGALGWRLLGYPIIYALSRLPDRAVGRTVGVMRTATELCVGERFMSAAVEAEIPTVLGEIAGELARNDLKIGELVWRKLFIAMPIKTVDGDRWFAAYKEKWHPEEL
ncbi:MULTISPECIES: hypothetical protein [unclassified Massilia]|uniref:hypothetical protein n=1 Tax=unclassified Massilia TaxID=2609279 RepID=UPI00177B8DB0|nr:MULTISPECIES: hypothetical protein [unclassified Massilia]MBD8532664.1 hypothetical protein [Massilia sp. CFBP 13647]MBD8676025.1 hypothetical protein [Massilia sp. CFBP 13721]